MILYPSGAHRQDFFKLCDEKIVFFLYEGVIKAHFHCLVWLQLNFLSNKTVWQFCEHVQTYFSCDKEGKSLAGKLRLRACKVTKHFEKVEGS